MIRKFEASRIRGIRRCGVLTAYDGVILHLLKVSACQDVSASGSGNEDLALGCSILHSGNLVSRYRSLQSVDGVYFSDQHPGTQAVKSLSTAFSNIPKTSHDGDFPRNHDICSSLDTVDEGFSAPIEIVEFRFSDGVIDIDGGDQEFFDL